MIRTIVRVLSDPPVTFGLYPPVKIILDGTAFYSYCGLRISPPFSGP